MTVLLIDSSEIYISGMQGFIQPNVGFQKEERTYIFNSATKEEESFNKFIYNDCQAKVTLINLIWDWTQKKYIEGMSLNYINL